MEYLDLEKYSITVTHCKVESMKMKLKILDFSETGRGP